MRDAVAVVEYFRAHLARVLPAFGAGGPPVAAGLPARIHRVLAGEGGWVARSVLAERLGGHEPAERVTAALALFEGSGRVERRAVSTGGRSREEWRLVDPDGEETSCGKTGNDEESPDEGDAPTLFPSFHVFPHDPFSGEDDDPDDPGREEVEDDRTTQETACGKTGNDVESLETDDDGPALFPSFPVFPHTPSPGGEDRIDHDAAPWEEVEDDRTDDPDGPWETWEEAL